MRLYLSPDGVWTGTQADAKAHAKEHATTWKEVEVPVDKAGLMSFLNQHKVGAAGPVVFSAPSPAPCEVIEVEGPQITKPAAPSYTHQSVAIDDAWDELSLARKLHFAALAMEEARTKL